jgi:hypothetical protein
MSKRRVRVKLTPRDPGDSPKHTEFARAMLELGIDVVPADAGTPPQGILWGQTVKDESLETDARRAIEADLEQENAALDAHPSKESGDPLPEPKIVATRIKRAKAYMAGLIVAAWRVTVYEAARGMVKELKDDGV